MLESRDWAEPEHYEDVLDFIRDKAGPNATKRNLILDIGKQLLEKTGHIPIVTNVSRGAGFCCYYARLSEAIGVKKLWGHLTDRIAGKGNDVHKIMGMASLQFFGYKKASDSISDLVDDVTTELRRKNQLRQADADDVKNISKLLFTNLLDDLERMVQITGMDLASAFPVVEQQFMDYDLHMRGTPDLILEDSKNQKAIVVDWKTDKETPAEYENAQVTAYALMEGRRLGMSKKEAVEAVLGHPVRDASNRMTSIKDISILPVIVRPTQRASLRPHPILFAELNELESRYNAFKNLTYDICVEAQHLSLLLTDQLQLTGVNRDETKVEMIIRGKSQRVNILRYTPRQLRRGNPSVQDRWPCRSHTGAQFCNLLQSCRYYFGRSFGEQDEYETALWTLRFKTFNINERNLILYRAIFDTFEYYEKKYIIEKLEGGEGIRVTIGHAPMFDQNIKMRIEAKRDKYSGIFRIDVLDKLEPERDGLLGTRDVREFEKKSRRYRVVNEGKPVLLTPVDAGSPLLSLGVFARVDEIDPEENRIRYHFRAPSKILTYQSMLFQEYIKLNPELGHNVMMFETNVDLTQMELNAIDALQRALQDADPTDVGIDEDELRRELTFTEETADEINEESEEQTIEERLKEIIRRGMQSPVQHKSGN